MNIENLDFWAELLWDYYSRVLTDDKPFYLAADAKLIGELAEARLGQSEPDTLGAFHQACSSALNFKKNGIKPEAFKGNSDSVSSQVICLAVQQVLVVEQMLADDDYSEAEYFPRYRGCLGLSAANANPLGADFSKIWETLAAELEAQCSKDRFVRTFWPGLSRKFRTSNLPLSQALFTTEDLLRIKRRAIGLLAEETHERTIFYFLQQLTKSNVLGTRARNLIKKCSADTEQRLCSQVRAFVLGPTEPSQLISPGRVEKDKHCFIAEREPDEWFADSDYFVISLRTDEIKMHAPTVLEALEEHLAQRTVLAFGHSDFFFEEINSDNPYDSQERLLIVVPRLRCDDLQEAAKQFDGTMMEAVISNVDEQFSVFLCNGIDARFCSRFGITSDVTEPEVGLRLMGGIRTDARTNTFLTGYPPTSLTLRGEDISGDSEIIWDQKRVKLKIALAEWSAIRDERRSSIEFEDKSIIFSLVPSKELYEIPVLGGFRFAFNRLEPTAKAIEGSQDALRGVHLIEQKASGGPLLKSFSEAHLIGLVGSGRRVPLSPDELAVLLETIESGNSQSVLAERVASMIRQTKSMILNSQTASLLLLVKQKAH